MAAMHRALPAHALLLLCAVRTLPLPAPPAPFPLSRSFGFNATAESPRRRQLRAAIDAPALGDSSGSDSGSDAADEIELTGVVVKSLQPDGSSPVVASTPKGGATVPSGDTTQTFHENVAAAATAKAKPSADRAAAAASAARDALKNPDPKTCSCKNARRAAKFSKQLGRTLKRLTSCQRRERQRKREKRGDDGAAGAEPGPGAAAGTADKASGGSKGKGKGKGADADADTGGKVECATAYNSRVHGHMFGAPGASSNSLAVGTTATFVIEARSSEDELCPGHDPFFWARLEGVNGLARGPPFIDVPIEPVAGRGGLFRASVPLLVPGAYVLKVTYMGAPLVLRRGGAGKGKGKPADGLSLAKLTQFNIEVVGETPAAVARRPLPLCRAIATSYGVGYWDTAHHWQPYYCRLGPRVLGSDASCLKNKHLLFIGDSLLRCLFWNFGSWLSRSDGANTVLFEAKLPTRRRLRAATAAAAAAAASAQGASSAPPPQRRCKLGGHQRDGHCQELRVRENKPLSHFDGWLEDYVTVSPSYNASLIYSTAWTSTLARAFPTNGEGVHYNDGRLADLHARDVWQNFGRRNSLMGPDPKFAGRAKVEGLLAKVRASLGLPPLAGAEGTPAERRQAFAEAAAGQRPLDAILNRTNVLLFGFSSHDMVADDLDAFRVNVRTVLSHVRTTWRFAGKLIWVITTPPVPEKQAGAFEHYKWLQTFPNTKLYRAVLQEEVPKWGGVTVDAASVAWARPELSYDGQHYVKGGDILGDAVYNSVRQAVTHEVCYNSD